MKSIKIKKKTNKHDKSITKLTLKEKTTKEKHCIKINYLLLSLLKKNKS